MDKSTESRWNVRRARQEFATMVDLAEAGERLPMERSGHEVAAVVARRDLAFLEELASAATAEALLAALAGKDVVGKSFARPGPLAMLGLALRERRETGGLCVMEFPKCAPAERAGRIVAIEFGGDAVTRDAHLYITGGGGEPAYLHGSIDRAVDRAITLRLSNGQAIGPERMRVDGLALSFHRVAIDEPIELEFTQIVYG